MRGKQGTEGIPLGSKSVDRAATAFGCEPAHADRCAVRCHVVGLGGKTSSNGGGDEGRVFLVSAGNLTILIIFPYLILSQA